MSTVGEFKSLLRSRTPWVWGALRSMKKGYSSGIKAIHSRKWEQAERDYEELLERYAEQCPSFFFIQIGANDGVQYDPIRPFVEKYGWRGVLIEPQPEYFESLMRNYRDFEGLSFENVAVSSEGGQVSLYRVKPDCIQAQYQTGVATLNPQVGCVSGLESDLIEEIKVDAVSLQSLVEKYQPREWHLLQVDTEGYDYEIVRQIDFATHYPKICCYEHANLTARDRQKCEALLKKNGYSLYRMERDTAGIHESIEASLNIRPSRA